jgi:hypothetical protein
MNRKDRQIYEVLTRVADFAARNVGLFPKDSAIAELVTSLESGWKTLSEQDAQRLAAGTAIRSRKSALAGAAGKLRSHMSKVTQLSQTLHAGEVRLPPSTSKGKLVECAKGFLRIAESMKKNFVDHGLPQTFADVIRGAIEEVENASIEYSKAKSARSEAVEKFAQGRKEALEALHRFDFLVGNALEGNPGALASYATARALERTRGRNKPAEESRSATPVPTTTASAAVA